MGQILCNRSRQLNFLHLRDFSEHSLTVWEAQPYLQQQVAENRIVNWLRSCLLRLRGVIIASTLINFFLFISHLVQAFSQQGRGAGLSTCGASLAEGKERSCTEVYCISASNALFDFMLLSSSIWLSLGIATVEERVFEFAGCTSC